MRVVAGYRNAEVEYEVIPSLDQAVTISFAIASGARILLGNVRFEGPST